MGIFGDPPPKQLAAQPWRSDTTTQKPSWFQPYVREGAGLAGDILNYRLAGGEPPPTFGDVTGGKYRSNFGSGSRVGFGPRDFSPTIYGTGPNREPMHSGATNTPEGDNTLFTIGTYGGKSKNSAGEAGGDMPAPGGIYRGGDIPGGSQRGDKLDPARLMDAYRDQYGPPGGMGMGGPGPARGGGRGGGGRGGGGRGGGRRTDSLAPMRQGLAEMMMARAATPSAGLQAGENYLMNLMASDPNRFSSNPMMQAAAAQQAQTFENASSPDSPINQLIGRQMAEGNAAAPMQEDFISQLFSRFNAPPPSGPTPDRYDLMSLFGSSEPLYTIPSMYGGG